MFKIWKKLYAQILFSQNHTFSYFPLQLGGDFMSPTFPWCADYSQSGSFPFSVIGGWVLPATSFSYAISTLLYFFKFLPYRLKVILHKLCPFAFDVFYSKLWWEWLLLNFLYQLLSLFSLRWVLLPACWLSVDLKQVFGSWFLMYPMLLNTFSKK